ncbi:hypothetical protein SeMB42_g00514 [Synchytrium endobioticum]|uniref:Uncharacterized protein n=1 Tax=Synchytrium endobioticum TaxID=286115 RepID=A0A507DRA8_9FUNG|nr:hypothetical protein SeMB42_g00514 [Synchytrium endobioticum]
MIKLSDGTSKFVQTRGQRHHDQCGSKSNVTQREKATAILDYHSHIARMMTVAFADLSVDSGIGERHKFQFVREARNVVLDNTSLHPGNRRDDRKIRIGQQLIDEGKEPAHYDFK